MESRLIPESGLSGLKAGGLNTARMEFSKLNSIRKLKPYDACPRGTNDSDFPRIRAKAHPYPYLPGNETVPLASVVATSSPRLREKPKHSQFWPTFNAGMGWPFLETNRTLVSLEISQGMGRKTPANSRIKDTADSTLSFGILISCANEIDGHLTPPLRGRRRGAWLPPGAALGRLRWVCDCLAPNDEASER